MAYSHLSKSSPSEQRNRIEFLESQMEHLLLNSRRTDEEIKRLRTELALAVALRGSLEVRLNALENMVNELRKSLSARA